MGENQFVLYTTKDGQTRIDVTFDKDTVWLSLEQMAELFQRDKSTISRHIKNIFEEGELDRNSVVANYATTAADGKNYNVVYYNLDIIISVGYRVKSQRGVQFRIWATQLIKEYLKKGFVINSEKLKSLGGGGYWEELLDRIRDIRSSEKVLYRQVLDLYATSVDYNPKSEESITFFKIVQNKLHYAAHGHTASEVIYERANAEKPFMGLTNFKGDFPTAADIKIAKNYLNGEELKVLNNLVSGYFDFAEIQAMKHRLLRMQDYIRQLDVLLSSTGETLLSGAGKVSHKDAMVKARQEYQKYILQNLSPVEQEYLDSLKRVEKKFRSSSKRVKDEKVKG